MRVFLLYKAVKFDYKKTGRSSSTAYSVSGRPYAVVEISWSRHAPTWFSGSGGCDESAWNSTVLRPRWKLWTAFTGSKVLLWADHMEAWLDKCNPYFDGESWQTVSDLHSSADWVHMMKGNWILSLRFEISNDKRLHWAWFWGPGRHNTLMCKVCTQDISTREITKEEKESGV